MTDVNIMRNNCIFAAIIHALMLAEYPELAYEQSWDGSNYSIVCDGNRITFSFGKAYAYCLFETFISQNGEKMFVKSCELRSRIGGGCIDLCIDSLAEMSIFLLIKAENP